MRLFDADTFLGGRELAIICLFLNTGIRLQELVSLLDKEVYWQERAILVYSEKTGRWRFVPVSDATGEVLTTES